MTITDEQYAEALQTIKSYREERGLDFYLPLNLFTDDVVSIPIDQFKLYIQLQKQCGQ